MTKKPDGVWINGQFCPSDPEEALAALSKMSGGIPQFAKDVLKKHMDAEAVDRADAAGRRD